MRVRYATAVVAMAVIPMAACGSDETVRDPGAVNPPVVVEPLEQPGVGEQGQGGAAQESLVVTPAVSRSSIELRWSPLPLPTTTCSQVPDPNS